MKLSVIATSIFATATAFAPNSKPKTSASSGALHAFKHELGAQPPLGFFDPLGIVADGDREKFDRLRYVEIKHGRISMLAVVGYLLTEADVRWPINIESGTTFEVVPSGFMAFRSLPFSITMQVLLTIGFLGKCKKILGNSESIKRLNLTF